MESVAWVEFLGPRGHVLNRQAIFKWPVRISHTYDGDVVVDDRSFPELTVDLSSGEDEQPVVVLRKVDQQPPANKSVPLRLNGIAPSFADAGSVAIGGDDVLQCGATRLRIRLRGHAVSHEYANEKVVWHRSWATAIIVAGAWLVLSGYFDFTNSIDEDIAVHFQGPFKAVMSFLVWWIVWSSMSRAASGIFFAREHLLIAGLLFASFDFLHQIGSIAAFATGVGSLKSFGKLLQLAAIGFAIHTHLLYVKPARPLISALRAALFPVLAWLFMFDGVTTIYPPEQQPLEYDASIWPSSFVIAQGEPAEQFLKGLDAAKEKVDIAANLIASRR